ncbi:MAG: dephospho-CoA kinase [Clostridiaceae bacterium]|nr:dephospho-CoA kinase [Clostridiaceae bacterium]
MKRVIGLTGGIGSGKSRILEILREEYGAEVIQADEVARQLEEPGQEGYCKIIEALGTDFLDEDKSINRGKLSHLIFKDKSALNTINSIIHPLVWKSIKEQVKSSEASLIVVEAALLAKNVDDIYDELWYVYTSRDNRIRRLAESRGYSAEKSLSIMDSQPHDTEFFACASQVIDNNKSLDEVRKQLKEILA